MFLALIKRSHFINPIILWIAHIHLVWYSVFEWASYPPTPPSRLSWRAFHYSYPSCFPFALMNRATGREWGERGRDSPAFLSPAHILTKCAGDKDRAVCLPAAQSDPARRRAFNLKRWLLTVLHAPASDSRINAINFDGCGPVCSVAAAVLVIFFPRRVSREQ